MPLSPAELERLRPVLERIVARLHPEEIWLFGSRAENRARPKSDFDLLAVLPDGAPEVELDPVRAWSIVRPRMSARMPAAQERRPRTPSTSMQACKK